VNSTSVPVAGRQEDEEDEAEVGRRSLLGRPDQEIEVDHDPAAEWITEKPPPKDVEQTLRAVHVQLEVSIPSPDRARVPCP
jgi:hypothetical protein